MSLAFWHGPSQWLGGEHTMADAARWAAGMSTSAYAIDDETAIQVVDGAIDVVSEGNGKLFPR